jgi:hypothetical protein
MACLWIGKIKMKDQLVMHVTSDGSLETVADSRMESIVISKGEGTELTLVLG